MVTMQNVSMSSYVVTLNLCVVVSVMFDLGRVELTFHERLSMRIVCLRPPPRKKKKRNHVG